MQIIVVGVNHRSCPIEVREKLAFRAEQLPQAYDRLRGELALPESLILSTCNRVEIYAGAPQPEAVFPRMMAFLSAHGRLPEPELQPALYRYVEPHSVEHLFRVASGLDSMVLGESDILHQVKHSYELARQCGGTGKMLNVLFQKALNAGKAVHERTGLGRGCVSVGTVAIELAQKIFGDLRAYPVLLLGAGKIGELVLERLVDRGVRGITVLNRSAARARELTAACGGQSGELSALPEALVAADIVISSLASPSAVITREQVAALMARRRHRPLCVVDLGVPRNVEAAVGGLENVYLFDIDDLQGLVNHHHAQREQALDESRAVVAEKLKHFLAWRAQEQLETPWSSELAAAR